MRIRLCEEKDIKAVCAIYNYYIERSIVSFEEATVSLADISDRVAKYAQSYPWLVCEVNGEIVGYAYAAKWQARSAYGNTVETSIYIKNGETSKGYGRVLYQELLIRLPVNCHAIVAGISLPNEGSVRLHEKLGFEKVAHFKQVGRKFGRWIDVGYWQKIVRGAE